MARKTRGTLFREEMTSSYDLTRPDEKELVEEAARLLDLADELDSAVKASGLHQRWLPGSAGRESAAHCAPVGAGRATPGAPPLSLPEPKSCELRPTG